MYRHALVRATLIALVLLVLPSAVAASDWDWTITPYGWASSVSVSSKINGHEIVDGEIEFKDLLDDTDFAAMVHFEGRADRFGIFADLILMDLGDEPRIRQVGAIEIEAESDLEITIVELGGLFYFAGGGEGFGMHYGVRMIDVDQEIRIKQVGPISTQERVNLSETLFDGIVGLRYHTLSESGWSFAIWGDVGAGGTESSWSAAAVLGYHFGSRDQFGARLGYRHLVLDLDEKDDRVDIETEMEFSGPMIGFTFSF